jgi:signal transduction histidine kinase
VYAESLSSDISLDPEQIQLGTEHFLTTSVDLASGSPAPVHLSVLISYDRATVFLDGLNRLLLGLGVVAVLVGSGLVLLISHTMTRPLGKLVAGVRALENGDFSYPLAVQGGDEVAEVTKAFDHMRQSLQRTQRQLLDTERLATIGRMASSISHDLRHPLTSVLANAEFLYEGNLDGAQREDIYQEIRSGVDQTTDLIDSLLEFSRARESLRRIYARVEDAVEHAVRSVHGRPEFHQVNITVSCQGRSEGWFDPKKLERGVTNLLLNACEAVPPESGKIEVHLREARDGLEIKVIDNGPGVPEPIRDKLFEPFVSCDKQNGTGLGLTVARKIFQDHGGDVVLESTRAGRTVFKLVLPLSAPPSV